MAVPSKLLNQNLRSKVVGGGHSQRLTFRVSSLAPYGNSPCTAFLNASFPFDGSGIQLSITPALAGDRHRHGAKRH